MCVREEEKLQMVELVVNKVPVILWKVFLAYREIFTTE